MIKSLTFGDSENKLNFFFSSNNCVVFDINDKNDICLMFNQSLNTLVL